jgi:flagellar motor switch protein FliM
MNTETQIESDDADTLIESSPSEIVENLMIPISIELARMRLSIKELGSLKDGQVVELNKRPGDLVDLVVSGKIIGKGELVEIEGELGVRISSLVK